MQYSDHDLELFYTIKTNNQLNNSILVGLLSSFSIFVILKLII